jgi:Flp pilus assembly protein TadD
MSAPIREPGDGPSKDGPLNYEPKKFRHLERDPILAGAHREGDAARQNPALESGQPPWVRSKGRRPFIGDIAAVQLRNRLALAPQWLEEPPPPASTSVKLGWASKLAGVVVVTAVSVIGYQLGSAPPASPPQLPVRSSRADQPRLASPPQLPVHSSQAEQPGLASPPQLPVRSSQADQPGLASPPQLPVRSSQADQPGLASERSVPTNDANVYRERGTAAYRSGDFMGAIGNFNEAIRLNPDEAQSYNIRGNVWDELGVFERALADYDEAIRIDPNNPAVFRDRAILWQRKGALDRALVDLDRAIRFSFADANLYCDRGLVWYQKGRHGRASADFDRAIKLDPNFAAVYINRGLILHRNREFTVAFADSKAIRVDPNVFDVSRRTNSGH